MIAVPNEMSIRDRVLQVILDEADPDRQMIRNIDELQDSDLLTNVLDSLGVTNLIMELEEEFDINISDEQEEGLHNIGDVVACIERICLVARQDLDASS